MHFAIVSYVFPPSNNIGGRRWAKFSRQLLKKGHKVTVITGLNKSEKDWYIKEFPGIEVLLLPKNNPDWLGGYPKTLWERGLYFFSTKILGSLIKQNIYDRGITWKKQMLNALENVHKNNPIDILVVTGGPFSLLYYGSLFKNKHKEIKYIADFRDPWTWGNLYGIPNLSFTQKNYQELKEYQTIVSSDIVSFSTESIGEYLKNKYPVYTTKLNLLPHAYDQDKFPKEVEETKREGFIYGGAIYSGLEEIFCKLEKILLANIDSTFHWDIYTGTTYPLINENFANGRIKLHKFVPEEELFRRIKKAAVYLVFFPRADKDLISTKFYEIIYTGTPILYIGEEGAVGRFIRENRLGVHILPENMEKELPQYLNGNVPFEKGYFDVSQYTFSKVTDKFLIDLEKMKNNIG